MKLNIYYIFGNIKYSMKDGGILRYNNGFKIYSNNKK